jgi:hypothetical protein
MLYWALSIVASLIMCTLNFIKSNPKETIGLQTINPFMWWLCMGWLTAYIGMTNWAFVRGQIGPVKALVMFTIFQVVFDVLAYGYKFGVQPKYIIAIILVAIAGAIIAD